MPSLEERLAGTLLGTAVGDALGLTMEGMARAAIARRFGSVDRYRLLGRTGFVSDDTEQSALVAQAIVRAGVDPEACADDFGRALAGWFLRLPWGIGLATLRACLKRTIGWRPSGVYSAGNGTAMRAAIAGVALREDAAARQALGRALAEVTHTDPRAVEGALFTGELAAFGARVADPAVEAGSIAARVALVRQARAVVMDRQLGEALDRACELAAEMSGEATLSSLDARAAEELGTTGFVVHTLAFATYCFARHGHAPLPAIQAAVHAGGDTDSIAAIVGAWTGALHGPAALPAELVDALHDGPFGPTHLRALAAAVAARVAGGAPAVPRYSTLGALARNLALYPVVIAHVARRWLPF